MIKTFVRPCIQLLSLSLSRARARSLSPYVSVCGPAWLTCARTVLLTDELIKWEQVALICQIESRMQQVLSVLPVLPCSDRVWQHLLVDGA